ncbi:MAG TPA: NINE protein [Candidatus Avamphibacillus intestinigallinarum]|nr:NINE protein [Candidatus Avamphibacillus intestinigallinarum]
MNLTNEERILVSSELTNKGKSTLLSYILLLFLGSLGIHRFYLGKSGTAAAQLILTIIGWMTILFVVGFVPLIIVGIWLFVDLFLVPGMVQSANNQIEQDIIATLRR